ncbi:putative L-carnitine dehydratase [Dactylonectria macrodidyma]|uniref:L-carnitine dehydratase n=1 Tax=Dactylonectria macrodidyma TaxID=307937 RepID=A0A9P9IJG4_9HYPO|nr:putative L-carnitine dehydratase [Dactylonectria macrodidyma]
MTSSPPHSYSVLEETSKVLREGILKNTLTNQHLLPGLEKYAERIRFEGSRSPQLPVNWRFSESLGALKALEATYVNAILDKVYGLAPQEVVININHALLFIMSIMLWSIDPDGLNATFEDTRVNPIARERYLRLFKDYDIHRSLDGPWRCCTSNIYQTRDGKYYHLHGSLNPDAALDMLRLPRDPPVNDTFTDVLPIFRAAIAQWNSHDIDTLSNDVVKTAGTICHTIDSYRETKQGQANANIGLWETSKRNHHQPAAWWLGSTSDKPADPSRPLAGVKVLDFTRIIAGPVLTRGLAELGASVMRVTSSSVPDATVYHPELNWGKWNTSLDLTKGRDRRILNELIMDCDVFVTSYRPGALDKFGFSVDDIFSLCKTRNRGIVVVRLNSYGWHGPLKMRSGWQQISDAHCGVSWEFGRAMGKDEPVTPVFPNSDFCTGISGICGVMDALLRRGLEGGSYQVDLALDYYNNWLVRSVGTYPHEVWKSLWGRFDSPVFSHDDHMLFLLLAYMAMLKKASPSLFGPSFFDTRQAAHLGCSIRTVKPVLQFPEGLVRPGFQVGTRGNAVDAPRWPRDLLVETVEDVHSTKL